MKLIIMLYPIVNLYHFLTRDIHPDSIMQWSPSKDCYMSHQNELNYLLLVVPMFN